MSLFRFTNPVSPTKMEQGVIINGGVTATLEWIERYRDVGEFTYTAPADTGVKELLPTGCYVGRIGDKGIMKVEDQQYSDGGDDQVVITGRSYEAPILEDRIVGNDQDYDTLGGIKYAVPTVKYVMTDANPSWTQITYLVRQHIQDPYVTNEPKDIIPYLEIKADVTGLPDNRDDREIDKKTLYSAVVDLLAVDSCGLRTIRPGPWSPADDDDNVVLLVHRGVDRREEVSFTYDSGDVESADYLKSIRKFKNCVLVTGKWVDVLVDSSTTGGDRHMMVVQASDIDEQFDVAPTGGALTLVVAAMNIRGKEALAKQRVLSMSSVNLTHGPTRFIYGRDYEIGDIVSVKGSHQESAAMRVTEYVHIEDENGVTGYPTLTDIETESDGE